MNSTRVAAIQFKSHKLEPQRSREELANLIEQAAQNNAKIVVCPEMAISGYLFKNKQSASLFAEEPRGDTFQYFTPIAKKYQIYIICGYIEKESHSDNLYNSAMVISPQGELIVSYRKVLLYDADMVWATAGKEYFLIETEYGTLTVGICMDLNDVHFPLFLLKERPVITAFCTNWLDQGEEVLPYWQMRLYGYSGIFIAANTWGIDHPYNIEKNEFSDPNLQSDEILFSGKSAILSPNEIQVCAPKEGNYIIYAKLTSMI